MRNTGLVGENAGGAVSKQCGKCEDAGDPRVQWKGHLGWRLKKGEVSAKAVSKFYLKEN